MSELEAGVMAGGEGAELDALVAEHVMGWTGRTEVTKGRKVKDTSVWKAAFSDHRNTWPSTDGWGAMVGNLYIKRDGAKAGYSLRFPPKYSTDLQAAWFVVRRFWSVTIEYCEGVIPPYNVTITARGGLETWEGWADTAPLAICRAALEAKGVDPDEHQLESAGDKQAARASAAAHPGHKDD